MENNMDTTDTMDQMTYDLIKVYLELMILEG